MITSRLNECSAQRKLGLCSVDPITLTGLALASTAGIAGATLANKGSGAPPTPQAPPAQAAPQSAPQAKTLPQSQQPTFLGAAATPPTQSGQKTLLGQ